MGSVGRGVGAAGASGPPPIRIYLNNIRAETANKTSDVLDKNHIIDRQGRRYDFKPGTKITKVEVFAGKSVSRPFRLADKFAAKHGGKVDDWRHMAGEATITDGKNDYLVEVHWFARASDNKVIDAYIKKKVKRLDEDE